MKTRPGYRSRLAGFARGDDGPAVRLRGVACLTALALLTGLAHPAMAGEEDAEQARSHLRRAAAASDLGNYGEAAKEYEAAYMSTSDASLLVDVGQAWQAAGERQKASTAFRSCVRLAPVGEKRATCEAKIRDLESQAGASGAPPVVVAPPPPPPTYLVPVPPPAASFATTDGDAAAVSCPTCSSAPVWIAVSAVVVAAAVVAIVYFAQDNDLAMPTTTFGAKTFARVRP